MFRKLVTARTHMLAGFTPPFTPAGRSSLVTAPPWHYAGTVFSLRFPIDPDAAQTLLPEDFGEATGAACGHFCEWQATTDGSELLDPVYAQYKEFFVLIEARGKAEQSALALYCPFIWVDQDIAMMRGLLQGWPKKIGSVWMTRSYDLDHPASARRLGGARLGASLSVKDRRLAELDLTLTGEAGVRLGFLAMPTYGLLATPTIVGRTDRGPLRLVRSEATNIQYGPLSHATCALRAFESPRDELHLLAPTGPIEASVGDFALTILGAKEAA
jgi:hypothetical protein